MKTKRPSRMKIIFFAVLFLFICLDLLDIWEFIRSYEWASANDDIFGATFIPFVSFILSAPFYTSELVILLAINNFSKYEFRGAAKICIIISMVIAVLIITAYLFINFSEILDISINITSPFLLSILNDRVVLLIGWIGGFSSLVLYVEGMHRLF